MKTKTPSEPSVLKWSLKSADHNATRVRNNQRRHRARAKGHVLDLEKRLEETSARLEAALQTIGHLTKEVEILRGGVTPSAALPQLPPNTASLPGVPHVEARPTDSTSCQGAGCRGAPRQQSPTQGPLEVSEQTAAPPTEEVDDNADCCCDGLPPPAPGESTLPCSSAFRIIEQQNFSGVEVTTIRSWLGPGFRGAPRPGEACRVETGRVYELLDHITSS